MKYVSEVQVTKNAVKAFISGFLVCTLLVILCLFCSSCADPKIQNNSENLVHAVGYFLITDENFFFVADGKSSMFADKEFIKIFPVGETVTFDGLNSGDKIGIDIETIGDLNPRVMDIHRIELIEAGDISNIDEIVISELNRQGFHVGE